MLLFLVLLLLMPCACVGQFRFVSGSAVGGALSTPSAPGTKRLPPLLRSNVLLSGGRQGVCTWVLADIAVHWGGYGAGTLSSGAPANGFLRDTWTQTRDTNVWTRVAGSDLLAPDAVPSSLGLEPAGRLGAACWVDALDARLAYLYGGYTEASNGAVQGVLEDVWRFNLSDYTWTYVSGTAVLDAPSTATSPGARFDASVAVVGPNVWVVGGKRVGFLNDVWVWSSVTLQWRLVLGTGSVTIASPSQPSGRAGAVAWTRGAHFYYGLGYGYGPADLHTVGYLSDMWLFNTTSATWTLAGVASTPNRLSAPFELNGPLLLGPRNSPGGRSHSMLIALASDGAIVVAGVSGATSRMGGGAGVINDAWLFDETSRQWAYYGGQFSALLPGVYPADATATAYPGCVMRSTVVPRAATANRSDHFFAFGVGVASSYSTRGYLNAVLLLQVPSSVAAVLATPFINPTDLPSAQTQSTGATGGLVAAAVFFALLIVVIVFVCCRRCTACLFHCRCCCWPAHEPRADAPAVRFAAESADSFSARPWVSSADIAMEASAGAPKFQETPPPGSSTAEFSVGVVDLQGPTAYGDDGAKSK